jgi:hypothetical protein
MTDSDLLRMVKCIPCPRCNGSGKEPDFKLLGGLLKVWREKKQIGLREMARRMDMDPGYLCRLEYGNSERGERWTPELRKEYLRELGKKK